MSAIALLAIIGGLQDALVSHLPISRQSRAPQASFDLHLGAACSKR